MEDPRAICGVLQALSTVVVGSEHISGGKLIKRKACLPLGADDGTGTGTGTGKAWAAVAPHAACHVHKTHLTRFPHVSVATPQETAPFLRVLGSYPMDTELGSMSNDDPAMMQNMSRYN